VNEFQTLIELGNAQVAATLCMLIHALGREAKTAQARSPRQRESAQRYACMQVHSTPWSAAKRVHGATCLSTTLRSRDRSDAAVTAAKSGIARIAGTKSMPSASGYVVLVRTPQGIQLDEFPDTVRGDQRPLLGITAAKGAAAVPDANSGVLSERRAH
jgi:hypothetical protein